MDASSGPETKRGAVTSGLGRCAYFERGSVSSSLDEVRHTTPEGVTMVVLDAFAWCAAGGDENAPRDMGIAIDALDQIKRELSATVCS